MNKDRDQVGQIQDNIDRNYIDAFHIGPKMDGAFRGWFAEEIKICDEFRTAEGASEKTATLRREEYPTSAINYLTIVMETERKPVRWWVFIAVLIFMSLEATGFSLIFADRLSDAASTKIVEQYAYGMAIVIAMVALFFAREVGVLTYRQGYARKAYQLAPDGALERGTTCEGGKSSLDLSKTPQPVKSVGGEKSALRIGEDEKDKHCPQSTRIVNRSDYVHRVVTIARQTNKTFPRFTTDFWLYVIVVLVLGAALGWLRTEQVEEYYAKEQFALSKTVGGSSLGPAAHASLDAGKPAWQRATGLFVLIFFSVQTIVVILFTRYGFASNQGAEAYEVVRKFRKKYGALSLTQYLSSIQSDLDEVRTAAQE